MNRFITQFFKEKEIPFETFEVKDETGMTHWMDTEIVIGLIEQAPKKEQTQIENILRQLDYKNGDIVDFLKFLGKAFVNNQTT